MLISLKYSPSPSTLPSYQTKDTHQYVLTGKVYRNVVTVYDNNSFMGMFVSKTFSILPHPATPYPNCTTSKLVIYSNALRPFPNTWRIFQLERFVLTQTYL